MPWMFLTGGGMRGGDLHRLIEGRSELVGVRTTAARYRFLSVADRFPALVESMPGEGVGVTGEVHDVPWEVLRDDLMPAEPHELELGIAELNDSTSALSMFLRRPAPPDPGVLDISEHGGWRVYWASKGIRLPE